MSTNSLQYWMNWRFALCSAWVLCPMAAAAALIWRHEGPARASGVVYSDEAWRPCLRSLDPAWLLLYRVAALLALLALLFLNLAVDGATNLFYYTVWTFVLVTIYFALGSLLSIHGCCQLRRRPWPHAHAHALPSGATDFGSDALLAATCDAIRPTSDSEKGILDPNRQIAGFWGYLFQIIFQTNAGAVMITDCVFWLVIFPFRAMKDYHLDLLLVGMHSVNVLLLIGDITLNSLRFPWFRISYFLLFTGIYVIFQWIVHACVSMWWPYPFLDLSSPLSPLWYLIVAVLHLPCYAVFPLVMNLKHALLSRCFPCSYHLGK